MPQSSTRRRSVSLLMKKRPPALVALILAPGGVCGKGWAGLHAFKRRASLLALQLDDDLAARLAFVEHGPFGLERVLIDERVRHVVHEHVLVGVGVADADELERDL